MKDYPLKSERIKYCSPQYLDKPAQCWNCRKAAPRNIVEWIGKRPNELYRGNYQVVTKKPVIDYKTGMKYWRYKLWDYRFIMKFGFFCTANCAMVYGNKAVIQKLKGYGRSVIDNIQEAKQKLADKFHS